MFAVKHFRLSFSGILTDARSFGLLFLVVLTVLGESTKSTPMKGG
jgi:hypothetical protein